MSCGRSINSFVHSYSIGLMTLITEKSKKEEVSSVTRKRFAGVLSQLSHREIIFTLLTIKQASRLVMKKKELSVVQNSLNQLHREASYNPWLMQLAVLI